MSFSLLSHAYADRLAAARALHAQGHAVVGSWSHGVPVELLLATGYMPIAIAPTTDRDMRFSRPFLLDTMAPQIDAALDQLVSGELDFLRLAIFASRGEEDALLYNAAKEVLRRGEGGRMPPLYLYVLMAERQPASIDYGLDQTRRLARRLAAGSGIRATAEGIADAVALMNRVRAAGRRLLDLRGQGRVSGVEAMQAIGAGRFMAPADYVEALAGWTDSLADAPVLDRPRLLVVGSESLSDLTLHSAIEAGGAIVVAEDDGWGSRAFSPDLVLEGDPIDALFHHYHRYNPSRAVFPHDVRNAWIYEAAKAPGLAGVVFHMPPTDRVLGWDYPRLRDYCAGLGLPTLVLRDPASTGEGRGAITRHISDFTASLEARA